MTMTGCARAAVAYARLGWPVAPLHGWDGTCCTCLDAECPSPAKHPRTRHGLKDASTDRATIEGWWKRWPFSNVGLLTGVKFDVCDIDGEEGDRALGDVARAAGDPEMVTGGPMASTGRGWHLLFAPTGEGNRARLVDHVDWRGQGGYIVAPPSVHASGRLYRWEDGCGPRTPLQEAPQWLLDLVVRPTIAVGVVRPISAQGKGGAYGRHALEGELGRLALAPVGARNDALNRAAWSLGQLVGGGELEPSEVAGALLAVALRIGLGEHEAEQTISSGLRRGLQHPRSRPA